MPSDPTSPAGRHPSGRLRLLPRITAAGLLATIAISAAAPALAQSTAPAGGFPLTIEHKYGSTTVEAVPERVVTVGLTEQDSFLALGLAPVGVTEWYGEQPYATWPWAADLLGDATPVVLGNTDGLDFEAIKALDPDLIVGLYSGLTQEEYDLLSDIAPVVAQPAAYPDWGIPWQEQTMTIGAILGKSAEAGALVGAVEQKFGEVMAAHPEFQGKTAVVATPWEGVFVYGPEDPRGRLLTRLGFSLPEGLAEATGASFGGNISEERVDLLDVDAIIWLDPEDGTGPLGGPLYESLDVHTQGREVFLDSFDDPLGAATSFVTVVSLPYLLDGLVPRLAAAVDGDPATVVPVSSPAPAS